MYTITSYTPAGQFELQADLVISLVEKDEKSYIIPITQETEDALVDAYGLDLWRVYDRTDDNESYPLIGIPQEHLGMILSEFDTVIFQR